MSGLTHITLREVARRAGHRTPDTLPPDALACNGKEATWRMPLDVIRRLEMAPADDRLPTCPACAVRLDEALERGVTP